MKRNCFTLLFCLSFVLFSSAQDFKNVAIEMGINASCGECFLGSGLSFADFNGDGWDDLTFATEKGDSILFYQNIGGIYFEKLPALVPEVERSESVVWVDYDNDGDRDLFVTNYEAPNRLYQNDGQLHLTDVTEAAGLPTFVYDKSYGVTFGDYNNDGWLDIYVSNWSAFASFTNFLFSNNGDGTFTNMSYPTNTFNGHELSFCAAFLDFNKDGWQDLYISQDRVWSYNSLLKNTGDTSFIDVSAASNTDLAFDAMNVGVADYDEDGDLDIYVTNTPGDEGSALLENNGDETFTDVSTEQGVDFADRVGWGGNFFDCENDGDLDLYVCGMYSGPENSSALFIHDMALDTFIEVDPPGMAGDTLNSFANAIADFNHDGLPDIAISTADLDSIFNPFILWENQDTQGYNWIKINLQGVNANREGIGSWIEVWQGGKKTVRYTHCGIGYLSQHSTTELIGLGEAEVIDTLVVRWLGGHVDKRYQVAANQTLLIVEGEIVSAINEVEEDQRIGSFYPNPSNSHFVQIAVDLLDRQDLQIDLLDQKGRIVWQHNYAITLSENHLGLTLPDLAPGLYIGRFTHQDGVSFRKLLLQ